MEKVITSFQVDKKTLDEIDEKAAAAGRNRSSWIRSVIAAAMNHTQEDAAPDYSHAVTEDTGTAG